MKDVLDRFIRSLAEQEQARDAPERSQDLGTFLVWLLERRGFTVLLRSFKHEGPERRKSSGLTQLGVDIIASRRTKKGRRGLYLFVLKQGNISIEHAGSGRGSIFHDVELASLRAREADAWFDLQGSSFDDHAVVAVHNGDLDERLTGAVQETRAQLRRRKIRLLWWDAASLVRYALLRPREPRGPSLLRTADTSLFPPGIRPFARAAIDSLMRDEGRSFDLDAVDRLLDEVLPVGRSAESDAPGIRLSPGQPMEARVLRRRLGELALFAKMIEIECRRAARDLTLPTLDTIERVVCRAMEHARRIAPDRFAGHRRPILALLRSLLNQYIARARALRRRLEPLLGASYGLALSGPSERIDYPLRALRLSGYLAVAGLALLDRKQPRGARRFAETLDRLWAKNEAACLGPVTDDQIIEIALVLELWRRCGMEVRAAGASHDMVLRLRWAKDLWLPLPALYQHARVPMEEPDLQVLAEAHLRGWAEAPPAFNDHGSTILPLAFYLAHRSGVGVDAQAVESFAPPRVEPTAMVPPARPERTVYLQCWQPPDDAADEWYAREIRYRGTVKLLDLSKGLEPMAAEFEAFNRPLPPSPAEVWRLPVLDRIAWKRWRTPPPMAIFSQRTG